MAATNLHLIKSLHDERGFLLETALSQNKALYCWGTCWLKLEFWSWKSLIFHFGSLASLPQGKLGLGPSVGLGTYKLYPKC